MVKKQLDITYDAEADAAYIYLKEIKAGEASKTVPINMDDDLPFELLALDFNKSNELLGIEILGASKHFPKELLDKLK